MSTRDSARLHVSAPPASGVDFPQATVDEPFQSWFERVTDQRVELMLRAEGMRPHPGWGAPFGTAVGLFPPPLEAFRVAAGGNP